tara:strand:- start:434 stop:1297 length:864 start_codon:yes stop_codon:yes gene_type:complete
MKFLSKKFSFFLLLLLLGPFSISQAESVKLNMVFVPASEKGDDQDYVNLIKIIGELTGIEITPIRVTDYNAAVEAVRANRAQIAWYGGKTYIQAVEIANVEAFAAGVRKGDTDASYFAYFVVPTDSDLQTLADIKGKRLALNSIGSTSGDLIPQVELMKAGLSIKNKNDFKRVYYAGSHDACMMAALNKHVDVCGMSSRNFDARIADGTISLEQIRIIHRSSPVPPPPLAYSKSLPLEIRNKIKLATLDAHNYGKIGGYGGEMSHYIEVTDSDYDLLRDVDKLLNSQ